MTFLQACVLFIAAIIAGVLNSVAGGGGLITFPALLIAGLPSISANATSTIASWPGCIASIGAYRKELQAQRRVCLLFGSVSLVGGMLGAILLLSTPSVAFDQLVPYLLLFSTLVFAFGNSIATRWHLTLGEVGTDSWYPLLKASLIQFCIAVYGGFYGMGISFLMLATMGMLRMKDIHEMNALKVLLLICVDSFAILTFLFAGVIAWSPAVLMMVGTVIGGYAGAYYARQLQPNLVRGFVITVGFGMTCYFFLYK